MYAYTGEITITSSNIKGLLLLATCLNCEELQQACGEFIGDEYVHLFPAFTPLSPLSITPENLDNLWELAEETDNKSLKDACYPLIAKHLLEPDEPPKFTNMCPEEFDNVFHSPNLREHASEEQKLSVIFKCLDVSKCSREVIEGYLDDVDYSQLSEAFWVDFLCENPILTENKDLR